MITLVTGEVNSGKKTWISKQIIKQICKEQHICPIDFIDYDTKDWILVQYQFNLQEDYTKDEFVHKVLSENFDERVVQKHITCPLDFDNTVIPTVFIEGTNLSELQKIALIEEISLMADKFQFYIDTQDYIIYYALRVAIKEGRLPLDQIKFIFMKDRKPVEVKIDRNGEISEEPEGFFDSLTNLLFKLV